MSEPTALEQRIARHADMDEQRKRVDAINAQRDAMPEGERLRAEAADAPYLRIQLLHMLDRAQKAEVELGRTVESAASEVWEKIGAGTAARAVAAEARVAELEADRDRLRAAVSRALDLLGREQHYESSYTAQGIAVLREAHDGGQGLAPQACRTTRHCADHGFCRRCDPARAAVASRLNVAIQRTDPDEQHWGPLYAAVAAALPAPQHERIPLPGIPECSADCPCRRPAALDGTGEAS